ncbi:MAG: hypothetical protein ACOCX1_06170, partial [Fimbriimonadaceae bacterium]
RRFVGDVVRSAWYRMTGEAMILLLGDVYQTGEPALQITAGEAAVKVSINIIGEGDDEPGIVPVLHEPGRSLVAEAEMQEVVAIAIETKIYTMEAPETNGFFFCIPTLEGLDTLFKKLGIRGAA